MTCKVQVPCPPQNKTEVTLLTPVLWWAMRCLSCLLRAGCSKLTNQVCRIRSADLVICFLLKQITIQVPCPLQNKTEVTLLTPVLWWAMRDLNPRPPQCRCDALPTAPIAHEILFNYHNYATSPRMILNHPRRQSPSHKNDT